MRSRSISTFDELKELIEQHRDYTGSEVAAELLANWGRALTEFVKVMPVDYKRALAELAKEQPKAPAKEQSAEVVAAAGDRM